MNILKKPCFWSQGIYYQAFDYDALSETIKATYEKCKEREMIIQNIQMPERNAKVITFLVLRGRR